MTMKENQALHDTGLYQPGVGRRVAKIVHGGDQTDLVPGTHVTHEDLQHYQLVGRRLQARATAAALGSLLRALLWPVRKIAKLAAAYARSGREAAAVRQLSALDDHLLEDIGIRREQIPAAVAGSLARSAAPDAPALPTASLKRAERPAGCNDAHRKAAA